MYGALAQRGLRDSDQKARRLNEASSKIARLIDCLPDFK